MRFAYFKRQDGGTDTFGYIYDKTNGTVLYQQAKCCPTDEFNKPKARLMCEGRMRKYGPYGQFKVETPKQIYDKLKDLSLGAAAHYFHAKTLKTY